ncbi:TonB family protein [bacterium]|nr:TonB family protein [bacterium]
MKPQIVNADLDDMLFENREREYGAYSLRKSYTGRLMIGTCSVLLFFMLSAFTPNMIGYFGEEKVATEKLNYTVIDIMKIDTKVLEEEKKIIVPPKPPEVTIKIKAFLIPEPVKEEDLKDEQEMVSIDSLLNAPALGLVDVEGTTNLDDIDWFEGDGEGEAKVIEEEKLPNEKDFIFVSEEPSPVNMEEIRKLIGYPELARDAGIEGQVVVRVLVDKFGKYRKHKVIKRIHPILAEACEKQLPKMRFTPAIQGGDPIHFWVNIPFKFVLKN